MKTILASTYAVNPYKGSEDAMGWNYVMQLARFNRVIAITRKNNEEQILKYQEEHPSDLYKNITFLYFDLPYWMRFWKKKSRGALLYFYMWQKGIVSFVKKQNLQFDYTHNLNFHNDWTPSFLWKLGKPFVWGPIGHHPHIPSAFQSQFSTKEKAVEKLKNAVKKYFWTYSPSLKKTSKNANHILCMNGSVPQVLDLSKKRISIAPSVATQDYGWNEEKCNKGFTLISAGRFVNLKGFDLTVKAYAKFLLTLDSDQKRQCNLILVGQGPQKDQIQELINKHGISENVEMVPWMEREELMEKMKSASAFVFPSHEGAGMVIPEALSFGLPCIVLDNWGPGQFINENCGLKVQIKDYSSTVNGLAKAMIFLFKNPEERKRLSKGARSHFMKHFHWDRKGEQLKEIYETLNATL